MIANDNIKDIIQAVLALWRHSGVPLRGPVTTEEIAQFKMKYGVQLPEDLEAFLLAVDGMEDELEPTRLIRIWPLGDIRPVTEECPEYSDTVSDPRAWFVFADFAAWSAAYAIHLALDQGAQNCVLVIGGDKARKVAETFREFLAKYLADDPDLVKAEG